MSESTPLDLAQEMHSKVIGRRGLFTESEPLVEKIETLRRGNYTVVHVRAGGLDGLGIAKRNPIDEPNDEIGFRVACNRAVRDLLAVQQHTIFQGDWETPKVTGVEVAIVEDDEFGPVLLQRRLVHMP